MEIVWKYFGFSDGIANSIVRISLFFSSLPEYCLVKGDVKAVLRTRSAHAGLHSNCRDPTIGMLLIFRTLRTVLN